MLTQAYTPGERGRAQAVNDLAVVLTGLLSSIASGVRLAPVGWQTMNALLLPWLALAAGVLTWFAIRRRRQLATGAA